MTSSLVGSEMCIRDRFSIFIPRSGDQRAIGEDEETTNIRPTFSHTFRTVSYTHLTLPTICSV
eukprot:856305-Prorocentrum_lima.AAC.1